jgi:phosphatidylglycerophosphatase C
MIPLLSTAAVLERLESARRALGTAAPLALALDADGTIWTGDIGVDAFTRLVGRRGVRQEAAAALQREASLAGLEVLSDPNDQANVLLDAYRRDGLDHGRAFRMMAWCFAGHTADDMDAFARELVADVGLLGRVHPEIRSIVAWAAGAGLRTMVVSASHASVVAASLSIVGLDIRTVVGMTPAMQDGVTMPWIVEPAPFEAGKPLAIARAVGDAVIVGAFGDSPSDLPMLALSRQPVAVAPRPGLASSSLAGLVELAVAGPVAPGS